MKLLKENLFAIALILFHAAKIDAATIAIKITNECTITCTKSTNVNEPIDSIFSDQNSFDLNFNFPENLKFNVQFIEKDSQLPKIIASSDLKSDFVYKVDNNFNYKINNFQISSIGLTIRISCAKAVKTILLNSQQAKALNPEKAEKDKHYKPINPYYDAIALSDQAKYFVYKDDFAQIIYHYNIKYPVTKNDTLICIVQNPFIKLLKFSGIKVNEAESNDNITRSPFSNPFSSIGATDITNQSLGVSLFLISRAKQELNTAFFQKFKNFVKKNPQFVILFPNTTKVINNLLTYQYTQMLPELRDVFYKDIKIAPEKFTELLLMPEYSKKFEQFPEFQIILNALTLFQKANQLNPPQLIEGLTGILKGIEDTSKLEYLSSSLRLTAIFSNAIRTDSIHFNDSIKNYWISPIEFYDNILSKPKVLNIFLGLIYEQMKKQLICFDDENLSEEIYQDNYKEIYSDISIKWYETQLTKLLTQVGNISGAAKSIKLLNDNGSLPTNQEIYTYVNTAIELFDFGYDFASHYKPNMKDSTNKFIEIAKNANGLYINTVSQKYALAINNTIFLLNTISSINKNDPTIKKTIFDGKFIKGISTYGPFIANAVKAEKPEEFQLALETAALPVGSSAFKKCHIHNIAINAYLGANGGNWPKDKSNVHAWNDNFRLTAPIGIAWTPVIFKNNAGSISVFASLFDVGAIVDYQLKKDSTGGREINQKIYLQNILSPGGYLVYGLPWNLPISIGVGGQYGPGLIKFGADLWNPSWKWNIFIGVDIPIFNVIKGRYKSN